MKSSPSVSMMDEDSLLNCFHGHCRYQWRVDKGARSEQILAPSSLAHMWILSESSLRLKTGGLASFMVFVHSLLSGWKLVYPFLDRPSITFSSNEDPSPGVCAEGEQASLHTHSEFLLLSRNKSGEWVNRWTFLWSDTLSFRLKVSRACAQTRKQTRSGKGILDSNRKKKNQWGALGVRHENHSDFWYVLFISSLQASGEFPIGGQCIHLTESCRAPP